MLISSGKHSKISKSQAFSGNPCAVGAHCSSDGPGAGGHTRFERRLESARQRVSGRCAGRVRDSDPELVDALGPVVLVVVLGDDDLGGAGERGGRCGGGRRRPPV